MKRNTFITILAAALAAAVTVSQAEAKTLYWTGQSSDGMPTTWLLGYAWSENIDANIGDCEFEEGVDDLVFSSRNVDNTESLTNYSKWEDLWFPVKVHTVTFNSYVSFGFAHIELTRDDLVAEGTGTAEYYDGFGKWTSARITWADGTVDPSEFDRDENLSVTFSFTDMNGETQQRKVDHVTTRTVEVEMNIPNYSTYYLAYRDTTLADIRTEAGKHADLFNTLVLNGLYGRKLTLGEENGLTLEARENTFLNGDSTLGDLKLGFNYDGSGTKVEIRDSLKIDGLCITAENGERMAACLTNESQENKVLNFRDNDVALSYAKVSITETGKSLHLGTVRDSDIENTKAGRLCINSLENASSVTAADEGEIYIDRAAHISCLTAESSGSITIGEPTFGEGSTPLVGCIKISGEGSSVTIMNEQGSQNVLTRDLLINGGTLNIFGSGEDVRSCAGLLMLDEFSRFEIGANGATVMAWLKTDAGTDENGNFHSTVLDFSAGGQLTLGGYIDSRARSAVFVPGQLELAEGTTITLNDADYQKILNNEAVKLFHIEGYQALAAPVELKMCKKNTEEAVTAKGYLLNNGSFIVVPEPATVTLSLLALACISAHRRRK